MGSAGWSWDFCFNGKKSQRTHSITTTGPSNGKRLWQSLFSPVFKKTGEKQNRSLHKQKVQQSISCCILLNFSMCYQTVNYTNSSIMTVPQIVKTMQIVWSQSHWFWFFPSSCPEKRQDNLNLSFSFLNMSWLLEYRGLWYYCTCSTRDPVLICVCRQGSHRNGL